jgi:hypothetical protein
MSRIEELDLSYSNVSGRCFEAFRDPSQSLKRLRMNCCPKLNDDALYIVLTQGQESQIHKVIAFPFSMAENGPYEFKSLQKLSN